MDKVCLKTVEMHAEGDPLRIVVSGLPEVKGDTLLQKRDYAREYLDVYRKLLMMEPRGHHDMYGAYLVQPDDPAADIACLLIATDGYRTMCGHALLSLGRFAVDKGLVKARTSPETEVVIQCPGGTVRVFVEYQNGVTGRSRIHSVPAIAHSIDLGVDVPGYGHVTLDISFGGVYYAILPAAQIGVVLGDTRMEDIIKAAMAVSGLCCLEAVRKVTELRHPETLELVGLCGTIFTGGGSDVHDPDVTSGVCVYADRQVPRAACGTGAIARIALMYAKRQVNLHETRTFSGPAGSTFTATAIKQVNAGSHANAVIVEITGRSYYTGECTFTLEENDTTGKGFLLT